MRSCNGWEVCCQLVTELFKMRFKIIDKFFYSRSELLKLLINLNKDLNKYFQW